MMSHDWLSSQLNTIKMKNKCLMHMTEKTHSKMSYDITASSSSLRRGDKITAKGRMIAVRGGPRGTITFVGGVVWARPLEARTFFSSSNLSTQHSNVFFFTREGKRWRVADFVLFFIIGGILVLSYNLKASILKQWKVDKNWNLWTIFRL